MNPREWLLEMGHEDVVCIDGFDDAILGISESERVVYDFELMVRCLMKESQLSEEEAVEMIEYNTIRALPHMGKHAPIILHKLDMQAEQGGKETDDINIGSCE